MMSFKVYLPWAAFIALLAGAISCVGAGYMGKDLRPGQVRTGHSNLASSAEKMPTENTEDFAAETVREVAPEIDYDLLQQFVCESLPTILPADGPISSRYGYRTSPFKIKKKRKSVKNRKKAKVQRIFHRGLDIAAEEGSYVIAAGRGRVRTAGYDAGYGNYVDIDHGRGIISRYAHARTVLVHEGDVVLGGMRIATVGASGHATGPHLHFEVLENGQQVDPGHYLMSGFNVQSFTAISRQHRIRYPEHAVVARINKPNFVASSARSRNHIAGPFRRI
jgi:murein DD-endopeptidase MepM/ murein hydrolase activator NlpD